MKTYNRKPKQIKAIQYDGSEEMANELHKQGYVTLECDEGGITGALIGKDSEGWEIYVKEGDYILENGCVLSDYEFEEEYEC